MKRRGHLVKEGMGVVGDPPHFKRGYIIVPGFSANTIQRLNLRAIFGGKKAWSFSKRGDGGGGRSPTL